MYNSEAISKIENRIGWGVPAETGFAIVLTAEVLTAESGRFVNSFHALATVENLLSAVIDIEIQGVNFNALLSTIRRQSAIEVLTQVIDLHPESDALTDYSSVILANEKIFDDAVGYCIAIKCLEMLVATPRKNITEINAKLSFQNLKIELEGVKNDGGFYIAQGIVFKMRNAILQAQNKIFKKQIIVQSLNLW